MDHEKQHDLSLDSASPSEGDNVLSPKKEDTETPGRSPSLNTEPDEMDGEARQDGLAESRSLEQRVSLPREVFVVALIVLTQLTTQAGFGSLLPILQIVGDGFGVEDPAILSWLIAGYSLTVGTFILFTGRLGDLFGWKRMLVIGYVWFGVWSLVAGLAVYSNYVLFIFARVLQGMGPAILLPNGLALLGGLYAPESKRKNMAFAVFAACAPGGAMLGSLFGALFAQLAWWPWLFFMSSIALFCAALASAFLIPDPQDDKPGYKSKSFMDAMHEMDIFGAVIGVTALILFNFAWNQAPIAGWASAYIIVTLILGVALAPTFFYYEIKVARNPLLPLDVFSAQNAFVLACVSCGWANFGIWVFYLWQILLVLRGASPLLATAYLAPFAISGACAAVSTGLLLGKVRPAWAMVIALCCFMTGTTLIATLPVHQIYWAQIFVTTLIAPFGMDISFPSATLVVSNSVKKAHQGVAASLVTTIVNYSISLGLGFAGTIEVHVNNGGRTEADVLHGYRSALHMAMGLVGLGLILAFTFVIQTYWDERRTTQKEGKREEKANAA